MFCVCYIDWCLFWKLNGVNVLLYELLVVMLVLNRLVCVIRLVVIRLLWLCLVMLIWLWFIIFMFMVLFIVVLVLVFSCFR